MKEFWRQMEWIPLCVALMVGFIWVCSWASAVEKNRYPVGQPVPSSVYTEPFDPCDPAYKFLVPPPKDWSEKFGKNERTMLIHSISELRVVVAAQGKRLLALEDWQKKQIKPAYSEADLERIYKDEPALLRLAKELYGYGIKDPNAVLTNPGVVVPTDTATTN